MSPSFFNNFTLKYSNRRALCNLEPLRCKKETAQKMAKFELTEGKKMLPQSYPSISFHPQNLKRMLHMHRALQSKKKEALVNLS